MELYVLIFIFITAVIILYRSKISEKKHNREVTIYNNIIDKYNREHKFIQNVVLDIKESNLTIHRFDRGVDDEKKV